MGCGPSSAEVEPEKLLETEQTSPTLEASILGDALRAPGRLSVTSKTEVLKRFHEHKVKRRTAASRASLAQISDTNSRTYPSYCLRALQADSDEDAALVLRTMDLHGLQVMWPEMDPESVKFLFNLFDKDRRGRIDTQEFVMAARIRFPYPTLYPNEK